MPLAPSSSGCVLASLHHLRMGFCYVVLRVVVMIVVLTLVTLLNVSAIALLAAAFSGASPTFVAGAEEGNLRSKGAQAERELEPANPCTIIDGTTTAATFVANCLGSSQVGLVNTVNYENTLSDESIQVTYVVISSTQRSGNNNVPDDTPGGNAPPANP